MRASEYFMPTLRKVKEESISFNLSLRASLISPLAAGIYSYLPLGLRVLRKIENIIRRYMNEAGGCEVLLPALQPIELWQKTGRDKLLDGVMITFKDRRNRQLCLGPTHEEVITELVAKFVSSYRQLPLILYQIQTKFRDELRPKSGLIRSCEFVMKDAYSFDRDEQALEKNYQKMLTAYNKIFKACGLETVVLEADSGFIGGSLSHEFLVEASSGEDVIQFCKKCTGYFKDKDLCPKCKSKDLEERKALEIGHIFKLGFKYSEVLQAFYLDEKGVRLPIVMGCYGIGVSRIIQAVIEQNHDKEGIIWPVQISPFDIEVICVNFQNKDVFLASAEISKGLEDKGFDVLFDDRSESAGVKFKDAYLLGIPYLVVIGSKGLASGQVELVIRRSGERIMVDKANVVGEVKKLVNKDII